MHRLALVPLLVIALFNPAARAHDAPGAKLPAHYVVKGQCRAGRGFVAVAEAPGYAPTYPLLHLLVFEGEIIGALFEVRESDGWKPWYNQPEGKPVSHDGGPRHYSHTIMLKGGPTAEQCKTARR